MYFIEQLLNLRFSKVDTLLFLCISNTLLFLSIPNYNILMADQFNMEPVDKHSWELYKLVAFPSLRKQAAQILRKFSRSFGSIGGLAAEYQYQVLLMDVSTLRKVLVIAAFVVYGLPTHYFPAHI